MIKVWYVAVAYSQLFGMGGGGQDPQLYRQKKKNRNLYARASEASERLRNIYFQVSKYICTYNLCSSLLLLMTWRCI